jgi:thioredoxin 1
MAVQELMFVKDVEAVMTESNSRLVVIDFYTDWCGPCRAIAPTYVELSKQYTSVSFYKINGEGSAVDPFVSQIKAYPTFLFIRNGQVVDKFVGGNPDNLTKKVVELATKFA